MKRAIIISLYFLLIIRCFGQAPRLKSIIYDFDGLDIAQTDLPDGDYNNFDLTYKIVANPITASDVLGDRVLELDLNWTSGKGEFGKGITKYIELDVSSDRFNFYCYNPLSNYASAVVDVTITEDDNANNVYDASFDDKWNKTINIPQSSVWQLITVSLSALLDINTGGNGIFDAGYTGNRGKVFTIGLTFRKSISASSPEKYFIDMLCFSQGALPTGNTILDLPLKSAEDYCRLGSLAYRSPADSVPNEIESLFPSVNKLRYINIFMPYAHSGTVASAFPGISLQRLLNNGYTPIITWEMMYTAFPPLDPVQPNLNQLTTGFFDAYIDTFADKVRLYSDTILIRLFHEFDGNWYPWATAVNNQDPNDLILAFRYIVDRFRARGTTNVKWIWSPNSSPSPNAAYNWLVNAYPGDNYVDIVATSIYNHSLQGVPPWRSFRSVLAESYYYLTNYFPNKPFFICETACRERYATEFSGSQTKAEWICQMDKDLQSYFSKTRALIFLSTNKQHDWRINSSVAALEALSICLWEDTYYTELPLTVSDLQNPDLYKIYPNPFTNEINIAIEALPGSKTSYMGKVYDIMGKEVGDYIINEKMAIGNSLSAGVYILELKKEGYSKKIKIIKQ
ncbi:MAG: glycosyl hydrolase [Bacteroidota bacterium]